VTDSDGQKFEADWSASFVRVRYELIITGTLWVALARLGLDLTKIPIVGVEVTSPVAAGYLHLGLGSLFAYFAAAFISKWYVEGADVRRTRATLDRLEARISKVVDRLSEFAPPDFGAVAPFGIADAEIQQLDSSLSQVLSRVVALSKYGPDPEHLQHAEFKEVLDRIAFMKSEYHEATEGRVNRLVMEARGISEQHAHQWESLEQALREIKSELDGWKKLRRDIGRLSGSIGFDRNTLGYYVPLLAAAGMFSIAIGPAIIEVVALF
jgi:hypothetical protein